MKNAKDLKVGEKIFLKSHDRDGGIIRNTAIIDNVIDGKTDTTIVLHQVGYKTLLTFSVAKTHKVENID